MSDVLQSMNIGKLADALAKAQGELEAVPKTKQGKIDPKDASKQGFTYWYADLASCLSALNTVFPKHGLAYSQQFVDSENPTTVKLRTLLMHATSGEWVASVMSMSAAGEKFDPKRYGIVASYMRRYAICAIAGLATEDNEDRLPKAKTVKPEASEERSHVNREITALLGRLGWLGADGKGDAAARAFFESWAADHAPDTEGPGKLTLPLLKAFFGALGVQEAEVTSPWAGPREPVEKAPKGKKSGQDHEAAAPIERWEDV